MDDVAPDDNAANRCPRVTMVAAECSSPVVVIQCAIPRVWRIEQDYRALKDEVGLDYPQLRSWLGWHHQVTLATMAYVFLVLKTEGQKKKTADVTLPAIRCALQALQIRLGSSCPTCHRFWHDSS